MNAGKISYVNHLCSYFNHHSLTLKLHIDMNVNHLCLSILFTQAFAYVMSSMNAYQIIYLSICLHNYNH